MCFCKAFDTVRDRERERDRDRDKATAEQIIDYRSLPYSGDRGLSVSVQCEEDPDSSGYASQQRSDTDELSASELLPIIKLPSGELDIGQVALRPLSVSSNWTVWLLKHGYR